MRPVLLGVTASLSLLASSAGMAHASTSAPAVVREVLQAELTRFDIDPQLEYLQDVDAGVITIDRQAREIVLILEHAAQPEGDPLPPEEIRLPLTAVQRGACATTYTAELDMRPVDGPLQALRVVDYQNVRPSSGPPTRPCPRVAAPVYIEYRNVSSGFGTPVEDTLSNFSASSLVPVRIDEPR